MREASWVPYSGMPIRAVARSPMLRSTKVESTSAWSGKRSMATSTSSSTSPGSSAIGRTIPLTGPVDHRAQGERTMVLGAANSSATPPTASEGPLMAAPPARTSSAGMRTAARGGSMVCPPCWLDGARGQEVSGRRSRPNAVGALHLADRQAPRSSECDRAARESSHGMGHVQSRPAARRRGPGSSVAVLSEPLRGRGEGIGLEASCSRTGATKILRCRSG